MVVLKVCLEKWEKENRDERELSVYRELGNDVVVMAKGENKDSGRRIEVHSFPVMLYSVRRLGDNKAFRPLNKADTICRWSAVIRREHPDIITCHDIPALLIGWLSTWFVRKSRKPQLIYDSHEFEIGRSGNRSRLSTWLITHLERFLIKRCAFSIMVNDSIADEVQRIHKLKTRPIVVRSTPSYWKIDRSVIEQKRAELCASLGVSGDTFLIMYHGGLLHNRGIETVIELVAKNPKIAGVILGNGDEAYVASLKKLAFVRGVTDRVLFHPAVSIDVLWQYVGAVDVGMVIVPATCKSYYYMLPNKFFENIQSHTPIIGSEFPEIRRIVNEYKIGLTCDPSDIEALNNCIEKMRTDKSFYDSCKKNLIAAKSELCWEKEKEKLIAAYKRLLNC